MEKVAVGAGVKSAEGIVKIFFESKINNLKQHLREQYIEKQISSSNIEKIFSSYITNIYKQCNDLETIMFPQRTIEIESIYEPLALEPLDRNHENIKSINSSYERDIIHDDLVSNLTILDTAGMGKSTFCKNIVVKVIKNTQHTKIPIFVELRKAQEQTLIQYIINDINLGYKNIRNQSPSKKENFP